MATPTSGIGSYIQYGYEISYGTASSSINKAFGHNQKLGALTRRNNVERLTGLNNVDAQKLPVKQFEGATTLNFVLGNAYWLKMLTGTTAIDAGTGPYTHTFVNTGSSVPIAKTITSFTLENGVDLDTDFRTKLLGCVINSATLSARLGETVNVSLDIAYANETVDTTLTSSPATDTYADPFVFQHATLEVPDGTAIDLVDGIELTIDRKPLLTGGLGSRFKQKAPVGAVEYSLRCTVAYDQIGDFLQKFYGGASGPVANPAETASLEILFDNGQTGTNQRALSLKFAGVQIDEESMPQNPEDLIKEEVTLIMRQWTLAQYTDNTAVSP